MSTVQRVAKNTGIVIAGDVIFRLISLVVIIYLARYLGVVDFGKYNFIFAYLAFFNVITDLGLQAILVREMARDPVITPKLIGNAYIIRGLLTAIAVISSVVTITLMSYPTDMTTYVYIATFMLLFISFSDFYRTIFEANLRMEYNTIAKLVFKVVSAGLILWIIFVLQGTLTQILLALVFSEGIKMLISYSFSRRFVRPRFEIDFGMWRYLLKECLPLALSSVIMIIYFRIDVVMLSIMQGDAPVGLYSAAYKLCEPLSVIPGALLISMFPIMSTLFKTSKEKLVKTYKLSFKYILIITLPIVIGTTLIADKIIFLIYGAAFAGSAHVLQILIWTFLFTSTNYVFLNLLVAMDKQKLNTLCIGVCAITNVGLNFILIPLLSYNGAAIATVVTGIVLFVTSFYFVSSHLQVLPVHKILIRPAIGGLIMGIFVYYFIDVNMFLLVLFAAVVYLVSLIALKTFTNEDWNIVKKIVRKKR